MRLLLARHGETSSNSSGLIQGHSDVPLNDTGHIQAQKLALRLENEEIDILYSSILQRAIQTANYISQKTKIPVIQDSKLTERCYGILEGKSVEHYEKTLAESGQARHEFKPSHGESLTELENRISLFLSQMLKLHSNKSVLIVAHQGTIKMILKILLKKSFNEWHQIQQSNTCLNILNISPEGLITPQLLNCSKHLN
jgi:probable phosphoglycerate mutase